MTARYAVYFVPDAADPLAAFGAGWLGWDIEKGCPQPYLDVPGLNPACRQRVIEAPQVYGFHATIKAPFRLRSHLAAPDVLTAAERIAQGTKPVRDMRLALKPIGQFLALQPETAQESLQQLATNWVTGLDALRAPLTAGERARRKPSELDARQRQHLDRWGYPYVMDAFRFHMTLTGKLPNDMRQNVNAALGPVLAPIVERPLDITSLAVVYQEAPQAGFRVVRRIPLTGD